MAIDKVKVIKVDTGEAQTSVKELRARLKELKDTMLSCEQGTESYNAALQEAADIQHTLKEQTEELNASAMDFGQITGNVVKATGGMVAGFQAAKATLSLFGVENEEVMKSLQKMQNLMAITQALPSIDNGVKAFKRLGLAIKAGTAGLHGFKAALVSTGIGAAVVAVGLLAANFDKLKTWITGTNDELEKQKKLQMEEHLKKMNTELDKRLSLEEQIRKAGGQDDLTIAQERVKRIQKEISQKELLIEAERRQYAMAWGQVRAAEEHGKAQSVINGLKADAESHYQKEQTYLQEIANLRNGALKTAEEQLKVEEALQEARELKAKKEEEERKAEEARKAAEAARKKRIEDEKKAIEDLKKTYTKLAEEMSLFDLSSYEKQLAEFTKNENAALETIAKAKEKGLITAEQYEADRLKLTKHYAKLREEAEIAEAKRVRGVELESMDINYQLQQAKLQQQYDEKLISEEEFNNRKKELHSTFVQDYIDQIQFMLDTEKDLTDEEVLDLTNKINEARASLVAPPEEKGDSLTKQISDAINASAMALNDFSDNPAWGKVLQNVALIAANWDTLHEQMKKGGTEAFTAYAQVAATAFAAIGNMLNGLAAEMDTSNEEGFESQKKMQIAGATMNMLSGIVSAWASSMQLGPIAGPILGAVLSAMMLATGIANIVKIKNTKFEGKGPTGGAASPSTGAISNVIAPVQYTQDVQGASIEGAIKDTKVYVTETDITDTQNRVSVTENEARY